MLVRDCMTARVETLAPEDDVATAREVFRRRRIRHIPVVAAGRVIGVVSDRDVRSVVDGKTTSVDSIMTPSPATTTPATPVELAASKMRTRKIGCLPVLEGDTLVGIVSESDLLVALVDLCNLMDPTTLLELDCEDDPDALRRVRQVVERHGGMVARMTAIRVHGARQRVTLRVHMPLGQTPALMLEEAGFKVTSCVMGRPGAVANPHAHIHELANTA